ncbi:MAG: group 1 truncated hemoglobin [Alphaproteobacteria bacterium HGW-Alphaproteobacteria-11]|nr:MAG: group 1 truncated hemoglobin [Alphaproteobacteria bacterium HGW-Alphaproteobacteria-11]
MSKAVLVVAVFVVAVMVNFRPAPALAGDTLYTALGGNEGIVRLVDKATEEFLADPRISNTFADTNIARFKEKLAEQFCELSGGPCVYSGQDMHAAHKGLKLRSRDFSALVENLQVAMGKCDIPFSTQNKLLALLAPMHRDVVTQ